MKKLVLLISLVCTLNVSAQYTLTAYAPPGDFVFEDLWHFTISGPATSDYDEFYVAMRIFNDQNALLIKSNSAVFALPTGNLYVNKTLLSSIEPLSTMYYDYSYEPIVGNGGFFPAGTYNVVLTLLGKPTDGEFTELAEANYSVVIQVFMPPILIFPEDQDTIDNPYPPLMWLPAYQAASGQQIFYNLRLTEMLDGQTAPQSITNNPSYFEQNDLPVTTLFYPGSAAPIQLNHTYAWQVAATINGSPVAYSQIWQFTYALPDTLPEIDSTLIYAKLTSEENNNFFTVRNNLLAFIYHYNDYSVEVGDSIRFEIIDEETNQVIKKTGDNVYLGPYTLTFGENYYQFDLSSCGLNLAEEKYYMLRVYDRAKHIYYLRFYNENGHGETRCE